jgi:hypothetical protein
MTRIKLACGALALLLLATGSARRPVEGGNEKFIRSKPHVAISGTVSI